MQNDVVVTLHISPGGGCDKKKVEMLSEKLTERKNFKGQLMQAEQLRKKLEKLSKLTETLVITPDAVTDEQCFKLASGIALLKVEAVDIRKWADKFEIGTKPSAKKRRSSK